MCLSVRRAQRAASSDGYDPESVILTLLSKMRRAQATRSDSRLLARCYVRAAYATPCLSIPLYDDTKSLLNCRLFCVSYSSPSSRACPPGPATGVPGGHGTEPAGGPPSPPPHT